MASCRCILKKLVRDGRITVDEYEKLLRNLKDTPQGKWVKVYVWNGDTATAIYRCSLCGWSVSHKVPRCKCGATMEVDE